MDTYSMLQVLKNHPLYKYQGDRVRAWIAASIREGQFHYDEFRRHLEEYAPDALEHLRRSRAEYLGHRAFADRLRGESYRLVCYGDPLYPARFYLMGEPPLTFMFWGEPGWQTAGSLSVVGSRDPREDSLAWMHSELDEFLGENPLHIVSGGARGIDQKAHALAIRRRLPTTIIVPSGLGRLYPAMLEEWKGAVREGGGCFLSEYDFHQPMKKFLFHHRNRLIAALGDAILIVEARKRSGTVISALRAAEVSRPVLVVPGHPLDKNFGGSLELLSEGAILIRDAQDLGMFYRSELLSHVTLKSGVEVGEPPEH